MLNVKWFYVDTVYQKKKKRLSRFYIKACIDKSFAETNTPGK